MKLSTIFEALAHSELSNLNVIQNGTVRPDKYPAVISAINIGLTKLYTRFKLKKKEYVVDIYSNQKEYIIPDSCLIEVINIYKLDYKDNLPVYSLFDNTQVIKFTSLNTFKVNTDLLFKDSVISPLNFKIEYLAMPVLLDTNTQDLDTEVELPLTYLNALLYFIGSRFHIPLMGSLDNTRRAVTPDMSFLQRYENECVLLENKGIDIDHEIEHNLFHSRGFI